MTLIGVKSKTKKELETFFIFQKIPNSGDPLKQFLPSLQNETIKGKWPFVMDKDMATIETD